MAKRGKKRPEALYRPLPPGSHGIERSDVERHQRARIQGATIEAVVRRGYPRTTLSEIVDLASVSRSTFYEHFADKQDCVVQTCDLLVDLSIARLTAACAAEDENESWRQRLRVALTTFLRMVAEEPAAGQLLLVEALAAGPDAVERRARMSAALEGLFRRSFDAAPADGKVSDVTVTAIAGGILHVAALHLRNGTADALPGMADDLLRWALGYQAPGVAPPPSPEAADAGAPADATASAGADAPAPPDLAQAREQLDHRQRIMLAVPRVVAEKGFQGLTISDISATAGISNQTFYATFKGKQEAFLAAFDDQAAQAANAVSAAFEPAPAWPEALRGGLAALLDFFAAHPTFARMAMVELPTVGDAAQQHGRRSLGVLSTLLRPGHERAPEVPTVVAQAITGGVWSTVHSEYASDRLVRLPMLAPCLAYVALAPYIGPREAAAVSRGQAAEA